MHSIANMNVGKVHAPLVGMHAILPNAPIAN